MQQKITADYMFSWIAGILVFTIGVFNLILVHPVPGVIGLLLSVIFFPPVNEFLIHKFGFRIPLVVKIVLALAIFWFTLGVSDLGEMIDKLFVKS